MSEKGWAKGAAAYDNYLERLIKDGEVVTASDYLIITGDITHDMPLSKLMFSLRWIRDNFKGKIVIIRGNHDKKWKVREVRTLLTDFADMFIIDEGEILSIGGYTFGCYSYLFKEGDGDDRHYPYKATEALDIVKRTVAQARNLNTIPVFLSHFPPPREVAEEIGKLGIKAYLSGHVHCTNVSTGDDKGVDMTWYDQTVKCTDDKVLHGCKFSTGTTDVLFTTTGTQLKQIDCLTTKDSTATSPKKNAADLFGCHAGQVIHFKEIDPFTSNDVEGFMCRHKGIMGGSLLITHVNGVKVDDQLIYGTPKLAYPYKKNTRDYIDFPKSIKTYTLAAKHNGMNVVYFRYKNQSGIWQYSAKSKNSVFLKDGKFGNFLSMTKEVLKDKTKIEFINYSFSAESELQSISFELCGQKEPHLVHYDFDIDLKPLFKTHFDGKIKPIDGSNHDFMNSSHLEAHCKACQTVDWETNEKFRTDYGLDVKYEYDHFATEGRVLYILDDDGFIFDRTMYKIKPKDIEEVHWQTFDNNLQGRVREAIKKVEMSAEAVSEQSMREELDMGDKEWSKFNGPVMGYIQQLKDSEKKQLIVLVGVPGSGKSTFAKKLEKAGYIRVNQDDLGSRKACKRAVENAFNNKQKVVVDRCNFDVNQRKCWLDLAETHGVSLKSVVTFNTDLDTCKERVCNRIDHPTVKAEPESTNIVDSMHRMYVGVQDSEPFDKRYQISNNDIKQEQEVLDGV